MSKKTIGILMYANPDYYPPTINAVHLLSEHFNVILIGRHQDHAYWPYPDNVTVYRLGKYSSAREREQKSAWSKLQEYIDFVLQARRILRNVSFLYAYDAFGYTAACLCRLIQPQRIPLIYHNHDLSPQSIPLSSLSGWVQKGEHNWVHKANVIVFPSQERALFFQKVTNYNGQLMIVPNLPRKSFFEKYPDFSNIISKRFYKPQILLQGAISVKNSLCELIDSLTFLDESIELKLIGNIWQEEKRLIEDFALRQKVVERIKYFMPVPYNELPPHTWLATIGVCLYKKSDINHVTMGTASNKIYEYAACGLPTIVSDQPNYRKYLADESWIRFADPDDPYSIALAVKNILSDFGNYQQMCLAAREAFEEKYNYELAFSPLLSKIQELLQLSE